MRTTTRAIGAIVGGCLCATTAWSGNPLPTTEVVAVEDFGATWCGPCVGAHYALERLKTRWGNDISILTYNVADELDNSYNSRRESEEFIYALPTFVFQGDRQQIGTPSDQTLDNWVQEAKDKPKAARLIGRHERDPDNNELRVIFKIEGYNDTIATTDEIRVVIWEDPWDYNWQLPRYHYHVQGGYDISVDTPIGHAEQVIFDETYDLSNNAYLTDWDAIGVSVLLYDTISDKVTAAWQLGDYQPGDMNYDLQLTPADVPLFLEQMGRDLFHPEYNPAADWDGNGIVNATDRELGRDYVINGGMR